MPIQTILLGLLAVIAGCGLSLQAVVNNALARGIGSPLTAVTISFLVGLLALSLSTMLTRQPLPTAGSFQDLPFYAWIGGGLLGAFFLFSVLFLVPRLGVAVVMSSVIAGQLVAAVLLDHYGILGTAIREATLGRLAGVVVMMLGVLMIRFL